MTNLISLKKRKRIVVVKPNNPFTENSTPRFDLKKISTTKKFSLDPFQQYKYQQAINSKEGSKALTELKNTLKKNFTLGAITINPMFTKDFSCKAMQKFCDKLNMPYHIHEVNIAETIANQDNKNACYSCAFFRRGAINGYAKEHGYNKIAYAHNHDDAVETFFMNLFYSWSSRKRGSLRKE